MDVEHATEVIIESPREVLPPRRPQRRRHGTPRPPDLEMAHILAWADAHFERNGDWPDRDAGSIPEAPREKWQNVNAALRLGLRGLPGGSSLAKLLAAERGRRHPDNLPALTRDQILAWADAHHRRTGKWPDSASGPIEEAPGETWSSVNSALREGHRGLTEPTTLPRLLTEQRQRPWKSPPPRRPRLRVEEILAWADAHRDRTGAWPSQNSGAIPESPGDTWHIVDQALRKGQRSLEGGSSLARLLALHRGHRNCSTLPPLTEAQIVAWADAHHERTGRWPRVADISPIPEAPGETWGAVQSALSNGHRGLPGGSSIARLLARERGVPNHLEMPAHTEAQILAWADAFHARTGQWPITASGPIMDAPGETWAAVDHALNQGCRGLPGGSSLARLLAARRGVRNRLDTSPLTVEEILAWADAHRERTGKWPTRTSGPIPEAPGETWTTVHVALREGLRGLPGGSTLARLLEERRGRRNHLALPPLTPEVILEWADAYHARHGRWPTAASGPVEEVPGQTWVGVQVALRNGARGLPGGSSLPRLLAERRQTRNIKALPDLRLDNILTWARAHHEHHGRWPSADSGPVAAAPDETWRSVDNALRSGGRGLAGGTSLSRLFRETAPITSAAQHPEMPPPRPVATRPVGRAGCLSPHLEAMRPKPLPRRAGRPGPDPQAAGERH